MKTPLPVKCLEIGCKNGVLSFHLSTLLGIINKGSRICCMTDAMGNESGDMWLDKISLSEYVENLSFFCQDYKDDFILERNSFDMVFINTSVELGEPKYIADKACKALRESGKVIAMIRSNAPVYKELSSRFTTFEEYKFSPDCLVAVFSYEKMKKKDTSKNKRSAFDIEHLTKNKEALEKGRKILDEVINGLRREEIPLKITAIELREAISDSIVNYGTEYFSFYVQRIQGLAEKYNELIKTPEAKGKQI